MNTTLMLRLDNIHKTFRRRHREIAALTDVSLEIDPGDFVGLYGPSRSGKTTLLRIAAGLTRPDMGSVSFQGKDLNLMSEGELTQFRRRELGCVWGSQRLVPGLTVLDTVALPLLLETHDSSRCRSRALKLLDAVGASQCADAALNELSDGERRRVMIAQAIIKKPRLLLADEPATNLGPVERDSIRELLQSLAGEVRVAVLVTGTHPMEVIGASPILAIEEGRIRGGKQPAPRGKVIELPEDRLGQA